MPANETVQPLLAGLLAGGFVTAFLHAALPTHWLPFVLVGRAQEWRLSTVLAAVCAAGLAHIATTGVLGLLIAGAGLALDQWLTGVLPWLSALVLIGLGSWYLIRPLRTPRLSAAKAEVATARSRIGDRAAFLGLVATLAATPGEVLLPFYLTQADTGVLPLVGLTLVFALGTVGGMAVFTCLAWFGWSVLRLERWARYEGIALGLALIAVGVLVLVWQH